MLEVEGLEGLGSLLPFGDLRVHAGDSRFAFTRFVESGLYPVVEAIVRNGKKLKWGELMTRGNTELGRYESLQGCLLDPRQLC